MYMRRGSFSCVWFASWHREIILPASRSFSPSPDVRDAEARCSCHCRRCADQEAWEGPALIRWFPRSKRVREVSSLAWNLRFRVLIPADASASYR